jgi:hypothetical protein
MARMSPYSFLALATMLALQSCGPQDTKSRVQMLSDIDQTPTVEDRGLAEAKAPLPLPAEPFPRMGPDGPAALMLEDAGEAPRPPVSSEPQKLDEPRAPASEHK